MKVKINLGSYLIGGVIGLLTGLSFSKAMYYKGGVDACKEIEETMTDISH